MKALLYVEKKADLLPNLTSGRKDTYNETIRRVRTTIVALEKQ